MNVPYDPQEEKFAHPGIYCKRMLLYDHATDIGKSFTDLLSLRHGVFYTLPNKL